MLPGIIVGLGAVLATLRMGGNSNRKAKEKALLLLQCWAEGISREMRISRELVDQLDDNQVTNLFRDQEVRLDGEERVAQANLALACNNISVKEETRIRDYINEGVDFYTIPQSMSITINAHLAAYLNLTEVILMAAEHRVADREIIYAELTPVVTRNGAERPPNGRFCHLYRRASGGAFPAIDRFVQGLDSGDCMNEGLLDRSLRFFWY
jgi:hypothetical protein